MLDKFKNWCGSDTIPAKTTRTIAQGLVGVAVTYAANIISCFTLDPLAQTVIVAAVMAVLAPIQAAIGEPDVSNAQHAK